LVCLAELVTVQLTVNNGSGETPRDADRQEAIFSGKMEGDCVISAIDFLFSS